jgi:hypothetical protein
LKHRHNLKRKFFDLENAVRRALKSLGARATHLGRIGAAGGDLSVCTGSQGLAYRVLQRSFMTTAMSARSNSPPGETSFWHLLGQALHDAFLASLMDNVG